MCIGIHMKEVKLKEVRCRGLYTIFTEERGLGLQGNIDYGEVTKTDVGKLMEDKSLIRLFMQSHLDVASLSLFCLLWGDTFTNRNLCPAFRQVGEGRELFLLLVCCPVDDHDLSRKIYSAYMDGNLSILGRLVSFFLSI